MSSVSIDPFGHLPHLRDRLTPPERSALRVTPQMLSSWDDRARELGQPPSWRLPDHALHSSRLALLGDLAPGADLWVFSYGSLMWDPGFHFTEVRLADLAGHQRRFSHRSTIGRGSPEQPALMLSLEPGTGTCRGLAFRIDAAVVSTESAILWRREMVRGIYRPRLLPVSTPQGEVNAVVFTSNPAHADHAGELPLEETAAVIAGGSGMLGTNREYLGQLAAQLDLLGIEDEYVRHLAATVGLPLS